MQAPTDWDGCRRLLASDDLQTTLRVRLVELAFSKNENVAVKAVDLLLNMGVGGAESDLADVPTEILEAADRKAAAWLETLDEHGLYESG